MSSSHHLFSPRFQIQKSDRERLMGQKSLIIWFTGLSGSGKSTLASLLEEKLFQRGYKTISLDGDKLRQGLTNDLSFDESGRAENIRRTGELCRLFSEAGLITIASFISPFKKDRNWLRSLFEPGEFIEVYVSTTLEVCEARDPNGLYKLARAGKISNFTGVDSAYEAPENSELTIDTGKFSAEECVEMLLDIISGRV